MTRDGTLGATLYRAWPLLLVMAVCVGLGFGGQPLNLALRYQRAAVADGAWWLLFTGNFVHAGWMHIGLDMAGLVLLWLLTGRQIGGWRWLALTLTGAWAVGLGLWWGWPNVVWYDGISGVAHTYWAAGAIMLILARDWIGWPLLLLLAAKLTWERIMGPMPSSTALMSEPVLTVAHLCGAIGGVASVPALLAPDLAARLRRRRALQ